MSNLSVNTIVDANSGNTAQINGMTPTAVCLQGFRNRFINGDMRIDQRNAGASVTPTASVYTLDRWDAVVTQSSKYSVQRNAGSVTPPQGFTNYIGVTSLSAYAVASGDVFAIRQSIEGTNVSDFGFGTANAINITLSFWVRSSLTGTFGGSFVNAGNNRSYPFTYAISVANTWEQKTVTIAGDTTGTWLTDTGRGIQVLFGLGAGTTFSGTAGAWASTQYNSATGAVSVVGTSGATFYITGVQLEAGSVATPFERRDYGRELALCQRYHVQFNRLQGSNTVIGSGIQTSTTTGGSMVPVPVTMRTTPTASGVLGSTDTYSYFTTATITDIKYTQCASVAIDFSTGAVGAQGRPALVAVGSTTTFGLSSEL